ncbi:MAG TPA: BON domain-containing protein [Candidatus Limnocylindrales bacterium]|nr:BON domain-containing protein [Candidatus Limnocylindrales bacterium]
MIRKLLLLSSAVSVAAMLSAGGVYAEDTKNRQDENVAERAAGNAARVTDDAGTTAVIKTKLLADQSTSGLEIDVSTKNGVVSLDGTVDSAAEKTAAERIAKGTNGVTEVKNNLKVQPD